ncbi:copper resistance protein B [Tistlia consotensis]|uniref:Copper resistance protein B n=1 Tax=Tistlia consotensis USBA 355 TaxID=560819 RepID=A0A1Y6BUX9_9PROT|nr:copper resistance protein B [Tistlia consotensis]SMF22484.1 copper resistance protein B [Tistlia consotensis USBA 355]SNR45896.1 copper resistance protein B [Tistlia consotensis]
MQGLAIARRGLAAAVLLACLTLSPAARAAEQAPLIVHSATFERLEYRLGDGSDLVAWQGDGWVGSDEWKLRLHSEGEWAVEGGGFETLENQLLVQHPVSDFFDLKAGLRYDAPAGPNRLYGVVGLQGLGRQWIETDAELFVSQTGAPSARLDLDYELLVTNRIILRPSAEINVAFADDREIAVGSGLSTTELGARLSYDLVYRNIAPYLGVHWERAYGETADLRRGEGEATDSLYALLGVRLMY